MRLYGVVFPNIAALSKAAITFLIKDKAVRVQMGRIIGREELRDVAVPFARRYWPACRVAWVNPRSRIYDAMMQMQVGHHVSQCVRIISN